MSADYREQFRRSLGREPVRQLARILKYQAAWHTSARKRMERKYAAALRGDCGIEPAPGLLRPPPHKYQGYGGPWIEDSFFRFWLEGNRRSPVRYLPVFWSDLFLNAQTHRFTPGQFEGFNLALRELLDRQLDPDRLYFTVLEYDHMIWDWHLFPRNVAVFSAGGWGDVPIPLLMGSPPFSCPPKDIRLSFIGRIEGASDATGVRSRMHAALRDHALFAAGANWRSMMARSMFSLCPRGLGRASFRLYEALSMGSIPVYIWDDIEWLPYKDDLDWSEIGISMHIDDIAGLPELIAGYSDERIARMQARIGSLYQDFFTLEGTCRQIARRAERLGDRDAFISLMKRRPYPDGTVPLRPLPAP